MKTISRLLASALILVFSFTAARAINPQKEYTYTPKDFGLEYVEDSVVTSDGYRINIWNLPGTEENGRSVLIACADAGNMGQWLGIGATLCFLGYDVWMFDYRGFGGSQDFATDRDMLYHSEYLRDFGVVLEHVAVLRDRPVDVLAFSMGTIMVGEHLRQYPGRKSLIRSCVMDGFISDPAESVRILNGDNGNDNGSGSSGNGSDNGKAANSGSDGKSVQLPATPLLSYGGNKRMQLQGILGEKAFRMADIAARWNIVQHFYPYHEEDGLQWEAHLPEMIEAVDTLKNGILSREDILTYREAVVRTMVPVRDAHLDISASLHPGFGIVSYYLAEANTTAAPAADTAGTEAEVRAEVIDSILIFNPSLTMECYEEFLPYLDSIIAGEYRAVAFDLREYPALDFDRVLAHLTDSALNTAPLFHTPLSCFPDRMHLRWDSCDDFVRPAAPRIDLPVYFLCGPESMSWCETILMLVKGYGLGTVIGSSTTGTNGDASTFPLPAFPFRMTAVKAVNLDGSRHHGTGVQPDIPAALNSSFRKSKTYTGL